MAQGFDSIIAQLERQKAAIDRALAALRDVNGTGALSETGSPSESPTRKGGMSPEGKQRLSAALKKRWAVKKRAAKKATLASAPTEIGSAAIEETPSPRKANFTPEGRKRLADAMKRRWAVKRAASAVKKGRARKKAA